MSFSHWPSELLSHVDSLNPYARKNEHKAVISKELLPRTPLDLMESTGVREATTIHSEEIKNLHCDYQLMTSSRWTLISKGTLYVVKCFKQRLVMKLKVSGLTFSTIIISLNINI